MKKHWKIAMAAVAVAGLIPYSYKKDKESGASVLQALFWSCAKKPNGDKNITIGLHIGSMPLPKAPEEVLEPYFEDEAIEEVPAEAEEVPASAEEVPTEAL